MNYNEMKNSEINKLVAHHLGYTEQGRGWIDNSDGIYWYICKPREGYRYSLPDYCNSWADAGPIIQEYGIELGYDGMTWQASSNLRGIEPYDDWKNYPESPCRLAMIVFLMIMERK